MMSLYIFDWHLNLGLICALHMFMKSSSFEEIAVAEICKNRQYINYIVLQPTDLYDNFEF